VENNTLDRPSAVLNRWSSGISVALSNLGVGTMFKLVGSNTTHFSTPAVIDSATFYAAALTGLHITITRCCTDITYTPEAPMNFQIDLSGLKRAMSEATNSETLTPAAVLTSAVAICERLEAILKELEKQNQSFSRRV
jgi:hypothetical protein